MRLRRNATAVLAAAVLMLGAAACGGESENPQSEPSTPDASVSPTAPTTTAPTWEKEYTKKQLGAYDAALDRWEEYETRSAPVWSRGKATEAAGDVFQEYFPSPLWQSQYRQLQAYEQAGITLKGRAEVLWSKPANISDNGLNVTIQQCVDYTTITGEQNGEPIEREAWARTPRLQTITLSKPEGHDWLVYGLQDSTSKKRPPRCTP
jgi:hypothetical protein